MSQRRPSLNPDVGSDTDDSIFARIVTEFSSAGFDTPVIASYSDTSSNITTRTAADEDDEPDATDDDEEIDVDEEAADPTDEEDGKGSPQEFEALDEEAVVSEIDTDDDDGDEYEAVDWMMRRMPCLQCNPPPVVQ